MPTWVRNCWYVIAWSHEITYAPPKGQVFSRTVLGEPIVVYRTSAGLSALADRCCHRGAPLSKGRVEGDHLRCGYHGLLFDQRGACVAAPGMAAPPRAACVKSYPVVEHNRWVFVWMGDPAQADLTQLPNNYSCCSVDWHYEPGYLHYDTDYRLICDNLLDFSHLSYVHEATLGGSTEIAQAKPEITNLSQPGQRGLRVRREVARVPSPPSYQRIHRFEGEIYRWWDYDFVLPGTLLMRSGGRPAANNTVDRGEVELHSCQTLTPETEHSTHYFFQQSHRSGMGDAELAASMHAMLVRAFDEDKDIISAQAQSLAMAPDFQMLPLHLDRALQQFRQLLAREIAAEHSPAVEVLTPTRPVHPVRTIAVHTEPLLK